MIEIQIKLYGGMRQYAPGADSQFSLPLAPGTCLGEVIESLALPSQGYTLLVNGQRQPVTYQVNHKDTLVLFPEVCGG